MVEQIHISCNSCKQVFNEVLEEAKKYSKSNPFICHLCLKARETPSQKIAEPDLPAHSRQNDSRTFNDPDVNAAIERERRDKIHIHIPIHPLHPSQTTSPPPQPNTLEHFESIATGPIKEKLDEFKKERERLEREAAEDRRRTAQNYDYDYDEGGHGHSILPMVFGIVLAIGFFVFILGPLFGTMSGSIFTSTNNATLSMIDCTSLSGNAGPHQTIANATGAARECLNLKMAQSMIQLPLQLFPLLLIVTVVFIILRVIMVML